MSTAEDDDVRGFYPAAVVTVARSRLGSASDFDDLVQEGVIAAWLATKDGDRRDPATYGRVALRHRVSRMMTGRLPYVGGEAPGSKRTHDLSRKVDRLAPLDEAAEREDRTVDDFASADLASTVHAAVRELEERDRLAVYLMFWEGLTIEETAPRVGLTFLGLRNRWSRIIRPALRETLAPLAAAA